MGQEVGKANLGFLISQISSLLDTINDFGAMHGNLRQENIIILLDSKHKSIENICFIGFEYLSQIEEENEYKVPNRIEHLPPDFNSFLLKSAK